MHNAAQARRYSSEIVGTGFLAFRDLDLLLPSGSGLHALDYGCGRGRSSRFLAERGFQVDGIDICPQMITQAKHSMPSGHFQCVGDDGFNTTKRYDIILNCLLLFDVSKASHILQLLCQQRRLLTPGGLIIFSSGSDYLLQKKWLSIDNQFAVNHAIKSGQPGKICLKHRQLTLTSWYWSERELQRMYHQAGFQVVRELHPLGLATDGYAWLDEWQYPPYVIHALRI